jgi:hypothetical protein
MDGVSERFDEKLFDLKMGQVFPEIYGLAVDDTPLREALTIQEGSEEAPRGAYEVQLIDRYLVRLREQLQGIDRIAREVWQIQGEAVTPEFVREILFPKATNLIDAWLHRYNHVWLARDTQDPYPALFRQVAVVEVPKLRGELNTRYEIEARTLEHKKAPISVTKAPAPITPVGGLGHAPYRPKPTEVPANPPTNFPSDLWPKTCVILADAVKTFPDRRKQMLELCKHFISEMTPLYSGAIVDGTMKADEVLREHFGGMQDLLRSLLIHNDDGPQSGLGGLSNQSYQIYLEARNSEEWRKLTKAIANAQEAQGSFKAVADAETEVFGQNFLAPANLAQRWRANPRTRRPPTNGNHLCSLSSTVGVGRSTSWRSRLKWISTR